jgi:hypothetical protein
MHTYMQNSKKYHMPAAFACALALLLAAIPAHANTLLLGSNPGQVYNGINVGPYPVTLDSVSGYAFCITESLTAVWGTSYGGTVVSPTTRAQEEAAFLASYALYDGLPGSNSSLEGPISYAIWEIMTPTLTSSLPSSVVLAAEPFVSMANYAYTAGLITPAFLTSVKIFVPTDPTIQSFVMAVNNSTTLTMDHLATPEPSTVLLFGAGLLLVGMSRYRRH